MTRALGRSVSCICGLADIVDPDEPRMWDAIRIVATEAPSSDARAYAEGASKALADGGPENLRAQLVYILALLRDWNTPRARRVKEILSEYAHPRGV